MSPWLREWWQAWRSSLRRPGFVLMASGVLAIGIAATVSSVALLQNTLFRPLPFPDASRLVVLGHKPLRGARPVSPWEYAQMRDLPAVSTQGAMEDAPVAVNVAGVGQPEQVKALRINHGLLDTLALRPALGRNFSADEDRPNGPRAVLLSDAFWRSHFASDPDAVGRSIHVEGRPYVVIGVLPRSFDILTRADLVLPLAWPATSQDLGPTDFYAIGRLAAHATPADAEAQLRARMLNVLHDNTGRDQAKGYSGFGTQSLRDNLNEDNLVVLQVFVFVAACVLLIGLVNLTNLMLVRTLARSHAAAVRQALGASLFQMAWPGLAEGVLIGLIAAVSGLVLAHLLLVVAMHWLPLDWSEGLGLGYGAGFIALITGALGALLAAALGIWRSHSPRVMDELREGGRAGQGRYSGRLGRVLVVVQMALASCLLCGAGMFLHALYVAAQTPMGFDPNHVETMELMPVDATYPDFASVMRLAQSLVNRLHAIPGVTDATVTSNLPTGDFLGQYNVPMKTRSDGALFGPQYHAVGPGFFSVFKIDLVEGRLFDASDVQGSEPVAIINASLARREYAGHAIGQRIWLAFQGSARSVAKSMRIVGVVADTHQTGPLEAELSDMVYVPFGQFDPVAYGVFRKLEPIRFAIRVSGSASLYADAMRKAVAELSPQQPVAHVTDMPDLVHRTTDQVRGELVLIGLFALVAITLAAVGMYAVMSAVTLARRRELGLRQALGATPLRMLWLVLYDGSLQSVLGLVIGLLLSLELSHLLRYTFIQIGRPLYDPPAMAAVALVLIPVGLLASLVPALRASRVAPMQALRDD